MQKKEREKKTYFSPFLRAVEGIVSHLAFEWWPRTRRQFAFLHIRADSPCLCLFLFTCIYLYITHSQDGREWKETVQRGPFVCTMLVCIQYRLSLFSLSLSLLRRLDLCETLPPPLSPPERSPSRRRLLSHADHKATSISGQSRWSLILSLSYSLALPSRLLQGCRTKETRVTWSVHFSLTAYLLCPSWLATPPCKEDSGYATSPTALLLISANLERCIDNDERTAGVM